MPFAPGTSGNPRGKKRGPTAKLLYRRAFLGDDGKTIKATVSMLRRQLKSDARGLQALELHARLNREIGPGSVDDHGAPPVTAIQIVLNTPASIGPVTTNGHATNGLTLEIKRPE